MRTCDEKMWTQKRGNSKRIEKITQRGPYKPYNLYSSSSIISIIKLREMSKHGEKLELHKKFYSEIPKERY
jgi:hypothetical protein